MPLATRPGETYDVVLSTDKHLPKKDRPVFVLRFLSILEWEVIAGLNDKFETLTDSSEMIATAFEVITRTLCGWRKMKTPSGQTIGYALEKVKSMLSLQEYTELMQAAVAQRPTAEDKKKSDSPSPSGTEKSAKGAKGRKSARTNPTKSNR